MKSQFDWRIESSFCSAGALPKSHSWNRNQPRRVALAQLADLLGKLAQGAIVCTKGIIQCRGYLKRASHSGRLHTDTVDCVSEEPKRFRAEILFDVVPIQIYEHVGHRVFLGVGKVRERFEDVNSAVVGSGELF